MGYFQPSSLKAASPILLPERCARIFYVQSLSPSPPVAPRASGLSVQSRLYQSAFAAILQVRSHQWVSSTGRRPISGVSSPANFLAFEPVPPAVASNHCVKEPKSTSASPSIWGSLAVFIKVQRLTDSDYYTASALPLRSLVGPGTYPNRSSWI